MKLALLIFALSSIAFADTHSVPYEAFKSQFAPLADTWSEACKTDYKETKTGFNFSMTGEDGVKAEITVKKTDKITFVDLSDNEMDYSDSLYVVNGYTFHYIVADDAYVKYVLDDGKNVAECEIDM